MIDIQRLAELQHQARTKAEREALREAAIQAERDLPEMLAQHSEQIDRMARALRTCGHSRLQERIRSQISDVQQQHDYKTGKVTELIEERARMERACEELRRLVPQDDRVRAAELRREIAKLPMNEVQLRIDQLTQALKFQEPDRCPIVNQMLEAIGQPPAWRESQSEGYVCLWVPSKREALETALLAAKQERAALIARRAELLHAIELLTDQLIPD